MELLLYSAFLQLCLALYPVLYMLRALDVDETTEYSIVSEWSTVTVENYPV